MRAHTGKARQSAYANKMYVQRAHLPVRVRI